MGIVVQIVPKIGSQLEGVPFTPSKILLVKRLLSEMERLSTSDFFQEEPSWLSSVILAGCPDERLHIVSFHVNDLKHLPSRAEYERESVLIESRKRVQPELLSVSNVRLSDALYNLGIL